MTEVDVNGLELLTSGPSESRIVDLVRAALADAGVNDGHVGVEIADEERMAALNGKHRGKAGATDVLSFPVDGAGEAVGPREVGDIVLFPDLCLSVERALIHGALHLAGLDHETDDGEMLELEDDLVKRLDAG